MTSIDFVIANPRHHLGMYRPVLEWLRERGEFSLRVMSLCELRGFRTPFEEIELAGAKPYKCVSMNLSKNSRPTQMARDKVEGRSRKALQSLLWHGVIRWPRYRGSERPSFVVLPNDAAFPFHRIVRRLNLDGIPFVLMQEGIRFEQPHRSPGRQYGQGGAKAVAAWGRSSARYFERVGVESDRIHLVGNPRLDELAHRNWEEAARRASDEIGIGADMLLFVSNPIDNQGLCSTPEKYRLFADFLRAGRPFFETSSYQLVVKLHAGDSLSDYQAIVAQEADSERVKLVSDIPIYPLIHLSRGVIVVASTAGLEAMLMDRPIGVLPVPGVGYSYDYVETGAGTGLELNGLMAEQLNGLLADASASRERRRAYVRDQVANFGNATRATGELMLQLVGNHQSSSTIRG